MPVPDQGNGLGACHGEWISARPQRQYFGALPAEYALASSDELAAADRRRVASYALSSAPGRPAKAGYALPQGVWRECAQLGGWWTIGEWTISCLAVRLLPCSTMLLRAGSRPRMRA